MTNSNHVTFRQRLSFGFHPAQVVAFLLTWLSYFTCYICRKPASIAKIGLAKDKHVGCGFLGILDTTNLLCYSCGQLVMGRLGDTYGARLLLGYGMCGIAATTVAFGVLCQYWSGDDAGGLDTSLILQGLLLAVWAANGFFQASGTPGCMKGMMPWFSDEVRGSVMGVWNTSYMAGDVAGLLMATGVQALFSWEMTFVSAGFAACAVAALTLARLVDHPEAIGLHLEEASGRLVPRIDYSAPSHETAGAKQAAAQGLGRLAQPLLDVEGAIEKVEAPTVSHTFSLEQAMELPGVLLLSVACFMTEFIRYALLLWLPMYLEKVDHLDPTVANLLSTAISVGGLLGVLAAGWLSDRICRGRRVVIVAAFFVGLMVTLGLYLLLLGHALPFKVGDPAFVSTVLVGLAGFFIAGPDSLLTSTMAMELGGCEGAATVTGLINGMGHLGAAAQGLAVPLWAATFGWETVFVMFELAALLGLASVVALLLPPSWRRPPSSRLSWRRK